MPRPMVTYWSVRAVELRSGFAWSGSVLVWGNLGRWVLTAAGWQSWRSFCRRSRSSRRSWGSWAARSWWSHWNCSGELEKGREEQANTDGAERWHFEYGLGIGR